MNQLDVLLLVLLLPFTFRGYSRGLCREAFGLAGSIAGVLAAGVAGPAAAKVLLDERLAPPVAAQPLGWAVVFGGTWVVAALLGRIAERLASALLLGGFIRVAGMLFGSAKAAALMGFTLLLIERAAPASAVSQKIAESKLGRPLEHMAGTVAEAGHALGILPGSSTHDGSHPRRGDPHRARARQPERGGLRGGRAPPPRPQRGRALPVPRRKDALVHGERGARLLPLLRLRRARRRVRLRDEDPVAHLPRGGAPDRRPLRRAAAGGGGGARPAPRTADRGERGGGGVLPGRAARPRRRPRARLPARARPLRGADRALRARLGAGRGRGARAPPAHEGRAARGCADRRARHAARPARGRRRCARPLPGADHVPDHGHERQGDRLRRPYPARAAGERRAAAQVPQLCRVAGLPQGPHALRPRARARP